MRLAVLAKKLKVTSSELKEFLEDHDVSLDSGSNTKLSKELAEKVMKAYGFEPEPESTEIPTAMEAIPEEEDITMLSEEVEEPPVEIMEEVDEPAVETEAYTEESTEEITEENNEDDEIEEVEIIRAPKVSLPGLKVKGKIELPEPRVKKETTEEEKQEDDPNTVQTIDERQIRREIREQRKKEREQRNKKKPRKKKDYNPVTAAREKAKREEAKKLKEEARKRKEKQRKHYEQMVQKRNQRKKSADRKTSQRSSSSKSKENTSGNVFQRFWRWLNTY
jgi:hypothetical protein